MNERIIIGPPGTGKTTRIVDEVESIVSAAGGRPDGGDWPCAVVSMTRAAAHEVQSREIPIPPKAVSTIHAQGNRLLALDFKGGIAERHTKEWNEENPHLPMSAGGAEVDDPFSVGGGSKTGDELLSRLSYEHACMNPRDQYEKVYVNGVNLGDFEDAWEAFKDAHNMLDFTDMLRLTLEDEIPLPNDPKHLLVDEAQDLSALEFAVVKMWGRQISGQLTLVGDDCQCLYEWRGARPDSLRTGTPEVLSQSYRVPRAVHRMAVSFLQRHLFEPFEYHPRDEEGTCQHRALTLYDKNRVIHSALEKIRDGQSVMLAASCRYMLDPLVGELRNQGIPFANPWSPKSYKWNPLGKPGRNVSITDRLAALMRPLGEVPVEEEDTDFNFGCNEPKGRPMWTVQDMFHITDAMSADVLRHGAKTDIKNLSRKEDELNRAVSEFEIQEWFDDDSVQLLIGAKRGNADMWDLINWWSENLLKTKAKAAQYPIRVIKNFGTEAVFSPPKLYIGSIHSFKGSEADNVFLFPDLSTKGMNAWHSPMEIRHSVCRMFYVGMTRARHNLFLCEPSRSYMPMIW